MGPPEEPIKDVTRNGCQSLEGLTEVLEHLGSLLCAFSNLSNGTVISTLKKALDSSTYKFINFI